MINAKTKKPVMPSRASVENNEYMPLSRPIFIYPSEASLKKPEVKEFVDYFLKKSRTIVPLVKYIPLPEKVYDLVNESLKKNKVGTVFGGHSNVSLKVEDLLKLEKKNQ